MLHPSDRTGKFDLDLNLTFLSLLNFFRLTLSLTLY